ncbi:MAG: ABC transporter permease [Oscillospiraceae bacterium]|nr:ABC transporter permease [Oscillospiraceae bacterium]
MTYSTQDYHVHISSDHRLLQLGLKDVWAYRDLIRLFTERSFKLIYKQTILGPLWLIISPMITSFIYTIVFGNIAGLSTGGVPKLLFYLSSHAFWTFFASCLSGNASTFIRNAHVFQKVYFPRLTIPISTVFSAAIQFFIQLALVGVVMAGYVARGEVSPNWIMLPLILPAVLVTGILGLGLGILVSSVTTKYRDLAFLVGFGLQLWMYVSPVVYPVSQMPLSGMYRFLLINPMTAPMEIFRLALLGTGTVLPEAVISTLVFTLLAAVVGIVTFNKVERTFIDTV